MLPIKQRLDSDDHYVGGNTKEYIVIHDTGNTTDSDEGNANYFCTGERDASAHYFVDDDSITQVVLDNDGSFHCGDGYGKYGIHNKNSIGIEQCRVGGVVTAKTEQNTLELVVYLMKKYNVPIEKVVRHYDASFKNCPSSFNLDGKWTRWTAFKTKLASMLTPAPTDVYRIRKSWADIKSQIGAYKNLDGAIDCAKQNAGYNVYDPSGKQVYPVAVTPAPAPTGELYRVRKSWEDIKSQVGAYKSLDGAIDCAKQNVGHNVYNSAGTQVYPDPKPAIDYEKELCRILVNDKNMIALTGKTKCVDHAKANFTGHIKVQCVKDSVIVAEFDVTPKATPTPTPAPQPIPQPIPVPTPAPVETPKEPEVAKVSIMGKAQASAKQMAQLLLSKNPNPSIGVTALKFAELFLAEGAQEGVRGDIAFCQAMHETGWLKFGGQVLPEQHNYAGIGATNNSAVGKGAWFKDEQEGIRAQIQHLKAYASKDALTTTCVDPRFSLVTRGIAPAWTDLNGRWAVPGTTYGQMILGVYDLVIKEVVVEAPKEEPVPTPAPVEPTPVVPEEETEISDEEMKSIVDIFVQLIKKLFSIFKK